MGQQRDQHDTPDTSSSEAIATFYLSDNGTGKKHWEYMDKTRMAQIFIELVDKIKRDTKTVQFIKSWLYEHSCI